MTKRKLPPATDWQARDIEDWNTVTFREYLIAQNAERFNADYVPFGKGSLSQRWQFEAGSLKQAYEKYGRDVIKRFIDECFSEYRSTAQYPAMTWGFIWSYRRSVLQRVNYEMKRNRAVNDVNNGMTYEEMMDLL